MTKDQFDIFWTATFPKTVPMSERFRNDYPDKWFRIHSLPESKRYPDNKDDWSILLKRQNQILSEILGEESMTLLITGEFNWGERTEFITDEEAVYQTYRFTRIDNIDLFKLDPENFDEHEIYRPAFAEIVWSSNKHDNLLKEIAKGNARAFFLSIDNKVLAAPYDGGVDFILKDSESRDLFRQKYKTWLSSRQDGL